RTFTEAEFPRPDPVRLRLVPGRFISGVVASGEGRPLEGAEVVAVSWLDVEQRTSTDVGGRFTLGDFEDQEFFVTARADGFEDDSQEVPAGTSGLRLVLLPA